MQSVSIQRQVVVSACFGTFLEWYDFLSFASLAVVIGQLFYPADDPVAGLLASLATFGVGMLVRPLGAAFFGSMGDRVGRRKTFLATIILMGVSTVLIGVLPTYAQVGLVAPVALVILRLLQGLAVGGEIGGAAVYLSEHAPPRHRGLYTSVLQLMGPLGIMVSSLQVVALQSWLSPEEFLAWGWRIPFLFSAILLVISLKSRLNLHESPVFQSLREHQALLASPLKSCWQNPAIRYRMLLLFSCVSAGGSLLFFSSQVYTGIFLKTVLGLDVAQAGILLSLATLILMPLTLLAGALSDRVGRRPVLLAGLLLGAVGLLPAFHGMARWADTPWILMMLLLVLVLALACITGPQTATLAELFPAKARYSAVALPHNLAAGWIGGLSPWMVTWLGVKFENPFAGLWYLTLLLTLTFLIGWRYLPETRQVDMHD